MGKMMIVEGLGHVWALEAKVVAHDRATYYASREEPPDRDTAYQETYDDTLADNEELWDWYHNNINWKDIPEVQKRCRTRVTFLAPEDLEQALRKHQWRYTIEEVPDAATSR